MIGRRHRLDGEVIEISKHKLLSRIGYLAFLSLLVAIIYLAKYPPVQLDGKQQARMLLVLWLCPPLLLYFLTWFGPILFSSDTVLRVDEDGIGTGYGIHPAIRWDNLGKVEIRQVNKHRFVYIGVLNHRDFLSRQSFFSRIYYAVNRIAGERHPIRIGQSGIDVPLTKIVEEVERLRDRYA